MRALSSVLAPAPPKLPAAAARRRLARAGQDELAPSGALLLFQKRHALESGAATGADTSLRWQNGRRGQGGAHGAERGGGECGIGGWALRCACAAAAAWRDGVVSVAVGAGQLEDDALQLQVAAALGASGLAAERLELGFDEALLEGLGEAGVLLLASLRDLGVGLAFDNFGAGAGSMTLLRRLPLTTLNLSRTLVRGVLTSAEDAAVIDALCAAAAVIGLVTVAEGVESAVQRERLVLAGCAQGQGPLFGEAVPADVLAGRGFAPG